MGCPVLLGTFTVGGGLAVERIALAPDASLIYGNNSGGNEIRRYSYPDLTFQAQEHTSSDLIERQALAIDDSGVLYWIEWTAPGVGGTSTIWKDTSSPTSLHSETGKLEGWTMCWNPYDGLLYVLDDFTSELFTLDTTTGSKTVVATGLSIRGTGASQTCPVPTLDGGIWWERTGTGGPARYDIPADTVATTTSDGGTRVCNIPRPNNDVWEITSANTYSAGSISKAAHGCTVPGAINSVGYTPTLDRVCYLRTALSGEVYELAEVGQPWTVGRVRWGSTTGEWH